MIPGFEGSLVEEKAKEWVKGLRVGGAYSTHEWEVLYRWGQSQTACLHDSSWRDCDYTPDTDNIRETRSILDHGSEGQGSVYVW